MLPADARIVIEIGDNPGGTLKTDYGRINPQCRYLQIPSDSDLTTGAIAAEIGNVDVLVYNCSPFDRVRFAQLLPHLTQWLKPGGQAIALLPNSQYWRLQPGEIKPGLTLPEIRSHFNQAGLYIYEVRTRGDRDPEFQYFLERIRPQLLSSGIEIKPYSAQILSPQYLIRAIKSTEPPRRLLIQTAIMAPTGCDRIRVLNPDRFSVTIPGTRVFSTVKSARIIPTLPQEEKVFIWQRTIMSYREHLPILRRLLQEGYLIVAEIDDNPLRRREYADNRYLSYRGCHAVQTSTKPLGVFLRQFNPNVAIFGNHLAELPPPRNYSETPEVTVFFGALNRERDWQPIIKSINKILRKYKTNIRARVIHDRRFFDALEIPQKTFEPFCPYDRYLEILRTCDIALLPLTPDPVNLMKSDLKFIESAGNGVAVLASPTVYQHSIIPEKTGLIYRTIRQFETHLDRLISDREFRHQIAANAYHWVRDNRLLCQHYQRRRDWYLQLRDRLPELNRELQQRVPELFRSP